MQNSIFCIDDAGGAGLEFAGIEISVEAREIAAGDFKTKFVAREEDVTYSIHFDFDFVNFGGSR